MQPGNPQQPPSTRPARRRNPRAINSCLECRERKSKCSKTYPCESCVAYGRECVFLKDTESDRKSTHAHGPSPTSHTSTTNHSRGHKESDHEATPPRDFEWESYQQSVAPDRDLFESLTADAREDTPQDERDDGESMLDMVFKFGRMVVTQRIDGLSLAHYAKDLGRVLDHQDSSSTKKLTSISHMPFYSSLDSSSGSRLLDGAGYTSSARGPRGAPTLSRGEAEVLYDRYLTSVNPVSHVLHIPSFKRLFDEYWSNETEGRHNPDPCAALVYAVCMAGGMSMPSMQAMLHFQVPLEELVRRLQEATENTLRVANCLGTSSITTLQALTVYLMAQCRAEVLRSHAALVGALIRLAQGIGLHHTASATALNHLHRHIRSLLWFNICLLDVKTSEAMGVQPLIRTDDFDVPLPLNMDDSFFEVPTWQPLSVRSWTDMTLPLIRLECNELHRLIFRGSLEVSQKNLTLHQLKSQVEAQKARIQAKYLPLLDLSIPIHRYASLVMKLLMARSDLMLLSRLLPKTNRTDSEIRLRDILIPPALITLEIGATLETSPLFAPWAWYAGAYQQYQDAPLLLTELFKTPDLPDAKRIGTMLDHVFGHCYGVSAQQRACDVLLALRDNLDAFAALRRMPAAVHVQGNGVVQSGGYGGGFDLGEAEAAGAPSQEKDIVIQWDEASRPSGNDLDSLLSAYPNHSAAGAGAGAGGFEMMGAGGAAEPMDGIFGLGSAEGGEGDAVGFANTGGGEWQNQGQQQWGGGFVGGF